MVFHLSHLCNNHTLLAVEQIEACEKIIAHFLFHQTYLLIDTIPHQRRSSPSIPAQPPRGEQGVRLSTRPLTLPSAGR